MLDDPELLAITCVGIFSSGVTGLKVFEISHITKDTSANEPRDLSDDREPNPISLLYGSDVGREIA